MLIKVSVSGNENHRPESAAAMVNEHYSAGWFRRLPRPEELTCFHGDLLLCVRLPFERRIWVGKGSRYLGLTMEAKVKNDALRRIRG